jgi:hypothetical protein
VSNYSTSDLLESQDSSTDSDSDSDDDDGSETKSEFEATSLFIKWIPTIKPGNIEYVPNIYSFFQANILEQYNGELMISVQKLLRPVAQDSMLQFFKFAVYLSSNNMLSDSQTDSFLQWITNNKVLSALKALCLIKMPLIKVFASELFWSALRLEETYVVQILLSVGVDSYISARKGRYSPLQLVCTKGNIKLAQILLEAGADVNALASQHGPGKTALQVAASNGPFELVQTLLEAGAYVNAPAGREISGKTALQAAA